MNKIELLLIEWDYCYEKTEWDWFPPLSVALNGLSAAQANWRPTGEAGNTIWETVRHLTFYKERLLKRLTGEEEKSPEGITNDDTFAGAFADEKSWQDALDRLKTVHNGIREQIAKLQEEDFERPIPESPIGLWVTGLVTHDAYHTGQIIQNRKLQGSWAARTSYN
jgi:hypothetical protein